MGIEPCLCIAICLVGFAVQPAVVFRAWVLKLWRDGWDMAEHVRTVGEDQGFETTPAGWRGVVDAVEVEVDVARHRPGRLAKRLLASTGVRPRGLRRRDVHTLVTLRTPLPVLGSACLTSSRVGQPGLHDPVLDQLVGVGGVPTSDLKQAARAVRDPLVELMGRYPHSVVGPTGVDVWVVGDCSVEEALELGLEVVKGFRRSESHPSMRLGALCSRHER